MFRNLFNKYISSTGWTPNSYVGNCSKPGNVFYVKGNGCTNNGNRRTCSKEVVSDLSYTNVISGRTVQVRSVGNRINNGVVLN